MRVLELRNHRGLRSVLDPFAETEMIVAIVSQVVAL